MSLRKSSSSRNGSKSEVLPKPNARRRCTPAPSNVGFEEMTRLTGRRDIRRSFLRHTQRTNRAGESSRQCRQLWPTEKMVRLYDLDIEGDDHKPEPWTLNLAASRQECAASVRFQDPLGADGVVLVR